MKPEKSIYGYNAALEDFRRARQKANMEQLLSRLTGKEVDVLDYDEIRAHLDALEGARRTLEDIPLDMIVGSVSRYADFSRSFLPLREGDAARWARVKVAMENLKGVPPIEVFRVGEVYFVKDGHHRVSVARSSNSTHIQAYVTHVATKVPLSPGDSVESIILKAEHTHFMEKTGFAENCPDIDLQVSEPGMYGELLEHIGVHQYYMGIEQDQETTFEEAAIHWYDTYYHPIAVLIRDLDILHAFPERTEADLYLWITKHHIKLAGELDWAIDLDTAARDLPDRFSRTPSFRLRRLSARVIDVLTPDELEDSVSTGQWRKERMTAWHEDRLFNHILLALTGYEKGWVATDAALQFALREDAGLGGLYVIGGDEAENQDAVDRLREGFLQRCEDAGVTGKFALERGNVARMICQRSRYADLVVLKLSYAPPAQVIGRLRSGLRQVIRRCSSPVLAVPKEMEKIERILLAFDGSPKGMEALYLAAYLADRWDTELALFTVLDSEAMDAKEIYSMSADYLEENRINADVIVKGKTSQSVTDEILEEARRRGSNLIVMGGYGANPLVEVVSGSTVNGVLDSYEYPVLICK